MNMTSLFITNTTRRRKHAQENTGQTPQDPKRPKPHANDQIVPFRSESVRANFGPKFPKPKISKFSICAAVAAAAGALRAAGLGTGARGRPPRRRRPHKYAGVLEPHTRVRSRNGLMV